MAVKLLFFTYGCTKEKLKFTVFPAKPNKKKTKF